MRGMDYDSKLELLQVTGSKQLTILNMMADCNNKTFTNLSILNKNESAEAILEKQMKTLFMDFGVPVLSAFGLIGNFLNLVVLTKEKVQDSLTKMEKSAHTGLIALAVSDFMFCLLAFIFTLLPSQSAYPSPNGILYYRWLGNSFITFFIVNSTWLIVIMAGERYLAVCHPFKARNLISLRKTKITVVIVYATCLLLTVPLFFEKKIAETVCGNGSRLYKIESREEYGPSMVVLRRMIWSVLFDFIPCVALLFFNACLIWKIQRAKKLRREMAPGQHKDMVLYRCTMKSKDNITKSYSSSNTTTNRRNDSAKLALLNSVRSASNKSTFFKSKRRSSDSALNSVTATLVAVVVLFLILVSPSEVVKFTYAKLYQSAIAEPNNAHYYYFNIILYVTNFMQTINFSINFILYCAVNKSFRKTLGNVLCSCKKSLKTSTTFKMSKTELQELS